MLSQETSQRRIIIALLTVAAMFAASCAITRQVAYAQDNSGPEGAFADEETAGESADGTATNAPAVERSRRPGVNLLSLMFRGGLLMVPIVLLSFLVIAIVIERFIGLRRQKIIPEDLVAALGRLGGPKSGFDPRQAYRLCQQFPSAASNVIRAMLLKVGRPHSEVEHAVAESSEREAQRIYSNVRWLNLAAAVAPLLGLLGTVWGMIEAFYETTQLTPGQDKADQLAKGIYVALVTTFSGLCVAIPAAIFSHYFEGRIQSLFHQIDELLFNLMPQVERYEGRVRFSQNMGESDREDGGERTEEPALAATERTPVPK